MAGRGPLDRIVGELGDPGLVDRLAALPGADLTSLLLEVVRRHAARTDAAAVRRRHGSDRFVAPAHASRNALRAVDDLAHAALPDGAEVLVLAPLVPFGTHTRLGGVDQHLVVSTVRGTEVAADPTTGLALEAAARRRQVLGDAPRSAARIRLAARPRVVRAQGLGPGQRAHFLLFGFVTAGRDTGHLRFERETVVEHARVLVRTVLAAGADEVVLRVSPLDGGGGPVLDALRDAATGWARTVVTAEAAGDGARYYERVRFRAFARVGDVEADVGDGGFVGWTRDLVGSAKERLCTNGVGLERLAVLRETGR